MSMIPRTRVVLVLGESAFVGKPKHTAETGNEIAGIVRRGCVKKLKPCGGSVFLTSEQEVLYDARNRSNAAVIPVNLWV